MYYKRIMEKLTTRPSHVVDTKPCSRCHKIISNVNYLRKNYKNTGEIREWKICNECYLSKLKNKISNINVEYNCKFNFISPYNNE